MTDQVLSATQADWMAVLYKNRTKLRTAVPVPEKIFTPLKQLGYIDGTPSSSALTAEGAGAIVRFQREEEEAKKAEKRNKKRRK